MVVDAETNKLVQVFNNDTDKNAETETQRYIQTGELPGGSVAEGVDAEAATPAAGTTGATGATGAGAGAGGSVDTQIGRLLQRQRDLLRDTERLREALRRQRAGG